MRRVALLLAAVLAASACQTVTASPAPPPTASPARAEPSGTPVPVASASPTPQATARAGIRATPVTATPENFRYVALDVPLLDGFRTRLWLVDLTGTRPPAVVAEWDAPAPPVGGHSASTDGRSVVVSAAGARSRVALYLLRPETGEVRVLFEDPGSIVLSPRISPDGHWVAFTRYPADGGSDLGVWAGPVAGGGLGRIADPSSASNVPAIPLAWSADSRSVAFTRDVALGRTEVHLVGISAGKEVTVGEGDRVSWRARAPELLVSIPSTPAARVYSFDLATRTAIDLVKVDKLLVPVIAWHPTLDRFAYVESEGASREASGGIWVRDLGGTPAQRLDRIRSAFAPEWSRDGTLLTALAGGDDSVVPVVDLLTGRRISVLCRRGGRPPADCL